MKIDKNRLLSFPKWAASALAVLVISQAMSLLAADKTWNDTASDFNSAGSWTGGLPGTGDAAVFPKDGDTNLVFQPNLSDNITIQQIRFSVNESTNYVLSADPGKKITVTNIGTAATAGTGAAVVGANNSGSNIISAPIILGAPAGSTQTFRPSTSGGTTIISGNVSESNAGIKLNVEGSSTAILRLSGSNSFSGGLTLNSTILEIGSSNAIPASGDITLSGGTLRSFDTTGYTMSNPVLWGGSVSFGSDTVSQNGTIRFTGPMTLTGNLTVKALGASYPTASVVSFDGAIGESGSRSLSIGGSTSGGSLGYMFLLGPNTYTGPTEISLPASSSSDILVINTIGNAGETSSSLGTPAGVNRTLKFGGRTGTLRYIGGQTITDRDIATGVNSVGQGGTSTIDASGVGPITFTGNITWEPTVTAARTLALAGTSSDDNTFSGVIPSAPAGLISFSKSGAGAWVLKGANTFTGGVTVASGKLVLDYTNNAAVLNSSNSLTLAGELVLKAAPSAASTQSLGNLTFQDYTASRIRLDPNGGSMALALGNTWTRSGGASTYINLPEGTELSSSPVLMNDVLMHVVVDDSIGVGFATTNAAGKVVRYAYQPYQLLPPSPPYSSVTNLYLTNSLTMTGGSTLGYTLAIDTRYGGFLNLGGGTRQINSAGALLFHGSGSYTVTNGIIAPSSTAGELLVLNYADGVVTLKATWGNGSKNSMIKSGPGTLVLNQKGGSGNIKILEGVIRADDISVFTNYLSGYMISLSGGILELGAAGDYTNALGTAIQILSQGGGFSAYGASRSVRLNNGTASIDWGSANFVPANNALLLSGKDANALIDFQNGLGFGNQQRLVRVANGSADIDARLSGMLTGGYGGGLIKEGSGALEITGGNNSYMGDTWIRAGMLLANNAAGDATGAGTVTVFGGAAIGGTGTVNRLTVKNGGALVVSKKGTTSEPLKINSALTLEGGVLDLSALSGLSAGDHVLVECGSLSGTFTSVTNKPAKYEVAYTSNGILLKGSSAGTVMMIK